MKTKLFRTIIIPLLGRGLGGGCCFLLVLGILACFPGCENKDYAITIDTVADGMHLAVSAEEVALSQDLMDETAVTFTWGEAQPRANNGVITYYFKLGLPGFTTATEKIKIDPGVFTYSLSHGDLNVLAHHVGIPYGDAAQLEAEIIASSEDGEFFVKPEISTVLFNVTTFILGVPVPPTLYLVGSANPAGAAISNGFALNNGSVSGEFLWAGQLQAGSFKFVNALAGNISSWSKGLSDSELQANFTAGDADLEFTIATAGLYSIYINMDAAEIIYGVKRWNGIWGMGPGANNPNWDIPTPPNAEFTYDYRRPGVFTLEVVADRSELLFNFIYDRQDWGWGSPFLTAPSSWHNVWDSNNSLVLNASGNGNGNPWVFHSAYGTLGPGVLTIDANAETISWELK
jgi:hypothetical protein